MRDKIEFTTRNHYGSGTIHASAATDVYIIGRARVGHIGVGPAEDYIRNGRAGMTVEVYDFGDTWVSFKVGWKP